ncbi:MAG: glutamine synthetase III, partial [Bacteroidaceae bacterium]|nr:glutamine synthetase III [Bacteroidaceae bacterium]
MSELRLNVVESAFHKKASIVETPEGRPCDYFGKYVFGREQMFHYLKAETYASLTDVIDNGAALDRKVADEVAEGMHRWAAELGVTHYTHWFQPLTEGTAEKHDSFFEPDGRGGLIEE